MASSSSSNWPPSLKAYVNATFAKCTDANRKPVEEELKALILSAFQSNQLWQIDWSQTKLESLNPKKRKLFVPSTPASHGVAHTAAAADEDSRRDKRAKRFDHGPPLPPGTAVPGPGSKAHLPTRAAHQRGPYQATPTPEPEGVYNPNVLDWDKDTVVGTSQKLEKPYLRLTSLPDPTTIRPLPVLRKTLELLKQKWRVEQNYDWVNDQFKSMRQDLTVQRIKNDFTCTVYEIHARIALEKGVLGEFNQCQAQLKELYAAGLPGHKMEFLGYQILYLLYSRNRAEMNSLIASLTPADRADPSVQHALAVRSALVQGSYTRFFRLFYAAPKMGAYVMDHFVPRERVAALLTMCKAYQQVPLSLIQSQLAFESTTDLEEFLDAHHAACYRPHASGTALDAKAAAPKLAEAWAKFVREGEKKLA